jgi:outer membrane protein assembly factor BamE
MRTRQLSIAVFAALIAGCQGMSMPSLPVLSAYRIDIQQGNLVTQDMVEKLQPGMSRSQVRFVLGTPLVTDVFHNDRWDYIYRYEKGGKLVENRRIVAVFDGDKLVRIEGDVVPGKAKPAVSSVPASPTAARAPGTPPAATTAPAPAPAAVVPAPSGESTSNPAEAKSAPAPSADPAASPEVK